MIIIIDYGVKIVFQKLLITLVTHKRIQSQSFILERLTRKQRSFRKLFEQIVRKSK